MKDTSERYPAFGERAPALVAKRNLKMARSAYAYVRGNTRKFYEWLESAAADSLPDGPRIWICGDCHVGNMGPVADVEGNVDIQIRDFDQTVIGNPAHDLIRLGLSLASAARSSDLPGVTTARMLEHMVEGYAEALVSNEQDKSKMHQPDCVRFVMKRALRRTWRHLASERIHDSKLTLPLGKRFWPLSPDEQTEVGQLFEQDALRGLATLLSSRENDSKVEVLDAAYWLKGCSSLGRLRIAVLLRISDDRHGRRELCLMDIKEASKPAAPKSADAIMPRDNAQRVVTGARHLSPDLGSRMVATRFQERAVVIRELLPQDLKLKPGNLSCDEATKTARFLARVLAKAHARQMDDGAQKAWQRQLDRDRPKTLDAPSWLWTSVVELLVSHESGYLEHCRRYACTDVLTATRAA